MKRYLVALVLALCTAGVAHAGDLGVFVDGDNIAFPVKSIDSDGNSIDSDSVHVIVWHQDVGDNTFTYEETGAMTVGWIAEFTFAGGGDKVYYFRDAVADIDAGAGDGLYTGTVYLWTGGERFGTPFSFTLSSANTDTHYDRLATTVLTTADNIGINWADVDNPTVSVSLTNTTLDAVTTVTAVTQTASIGNGGITAGTFAAGAIDADALKADAVDKIGDGVLLRIRGTVRFGAGTTYFTDSSGNLLGLDDTYNDNMVVVKVADSAWQAARITDYFQTRDSIVLTPALSTAPAAGDSFMVFGILGDLVTLPGDSLATLMTNVDAIKTETDGGDAAWATATGFSTHTPANVTDDWETQSQADPTGFHVNVREWIGTAPLSLASQRIQVDVVAIETGDATDALDAALGRFVDTIAISRGTAQAGSANTITLAAGEPATADLYNGLMVTIYAGTGVGQSRMIYDWDASDVATITPNWITNPSSDSRYILWSWAGAAVERWSTGSVSFFDVARKGASALESAMADSIWGLAQVDQATAGTFGEIAAEIAAIKAETDGGDAAWATATGFSTHSAGDVWTSGTRTLTDKTGFSLAADQSGVTIGQVDTLGHGATHALALHAADSGQTYNLKASQSGVTIGTVTNVGTVTGNVDGSVGSVTGAVGSVTGAVGSVTGNVGGSVASVTGNIDGSVNSVATAVTVDTIGHGAVHAIASELVDTNNVARNSTAGDYKATGYAVAGDAMTLKADSLATLMAGVDAVKAKTDSLDFTANGDSAFLHTDMRYVAGDGIYDSTALRGAGSGDSNTTAGITFAVHEAITARNVARDSTKDDYKSGGVSEATVRTIFGDSLTTTIARIDDLVMFFAACDDCWYQLFPSDGTLNKDSAYCYNPALGVDSLDGRIIWYHSNQAAVYDSARFDRPPF